MYAKCMQPGSPNGVVPSIDMEWVAVGEPEVQRQRGRWVVRVSGYDPATGRRRVRQFGTFATKREAAARQRVLLEGRTGTASETVAEFLDKVWLPSKAGRVEPSTYDQYGWAMRRHVVPLIGAVQLRDLTAEVVDGWIGRLREPSAGDGERKALGPTSARLVRKVFSMAMEEAVQRGRLPSNPVTLTQPPRRQRNHKKLSWTVDEARTFLVTARDHRLYAAFHLCLVTGLRRGEVLALRWDELDMERAELEVTQQLALERGRPVIKGLKTETSERRVTFGPATAAVLRAHRERQLIEAAFAGGAWRDKGLVFTTAVGGWVDPNNFRRLMDQLVVRAGVARITPKGTVSLTV